MVHSNHLKIKAEKVSKWMITFITVVTVFILFSGIVVSLTYLFGIDVTFLRDPLIFNSLDEDIPGFNNFTKTKQAKLVIAEAVSISLAFLLAAGLLQQTLIPDYYHLGLLGGLVIIHVVIGYTVNKEINDAVQQQISWIKDRPRL